MYDYYDDQNKTLQNILLLISLINVEKQMQIHAHSQEKENRTHENS